MSTIESGAALSDVLVLDFTHAEAGPYCTQMLAYLGADVIKVERPGIGDYMRQGAMLRPSSSEVSDVSVNFTYLNAGKRSLVVDLKTADGIKTFRALAAQADVLVENMGPGVVDRLGLGYEDLRQINPRLIYAQLKGLAPGTRWGSFPSFDPVGQSTGGVMAVTGYEGGVPIRTGPAVADSGSGLHLAVGILAALNQRAITGHGQRIEMSMQDSTMSFVRRAFAQHAVDGAPQARSGNRIFVGDDVSAGMYPCAPGGVNDYCYIEVDHAGNGWERFARAMHNDELLHDERFVDAEGRSAHKVELDEVISTWSSTLSKYEVMDRLLDAGLPAGAVLSPNDLLHDGDYLDRGVLTEIVRASGTDPVPVLGLPFQMSASQVRPQRAPHLGEHTNEVMEQLFQAATTDNAR